MNEKRLNDQKKQLADLKKRAIPAPPGMFRIRTNVKEKKVAK